MALLTTGLINNSEVSGVRASSTLSVKITNRSKPLRIRVCEDVRSDWDEF